MPGGPPPGGPGGPEGAPGGPPPGGPPAASVPSMPPGNLPLAANNPPIGVAPLMQQALAGIPDEELAARQADILSRQQ